MSAPARMRVASANMITLPKNHKMYKARKKIETDLEIGDTALIDGATEIKIVNKGNCAATVEFNNGDRTVISFDRLQKKPTSLADEEGK
ncbi:hypothetical protein [Enterococcus sp. AZ126]|uniref:hypothetical protein n=1 Tax=Enterococcus sp. AZ126 TaxID=2774635 RepID=UPI003F297535